MSDRMCWALNQVVQSIPQDLSGVKCLRKVMLGGVSSFSWSPDSEYLVGLTNVGFGTAYEITSGRVRDNLNIYRGFSMKPITWASDHLMCYVSPDGNLRLQDLGEGNRTSAILEGSDIISAPPVFSPTGQYLASEIDGGLCVWDMRAFKIHKKIDHSEIKKASSRTVSKIVWSPNEEFLAISKTGMISILSFDDVDVNFNTYPSSLNFEDSVQWSPDSKNFIIRPEVDKSKHYPKLEVYDSKSLEIVHEFTELGVYTNLFKYSPDGKYLATGSQDATIRLWDASDYSKINSFKLHKDPSVMGWSPDSSKLCLAADNVVFVWDVIGDQTRLYERVDSHVNALAFSNDSQKLAVGFGNNFVVYQGGIDE